MESLIKFFNKIKRMSPELEEEFRNRWEGRLFKKNEIIQRPDNGVKKMFFIEQGIIGGYRMKEKGQRGITWIMKEGNVVFPSGYWRDDNLFPEGVIALEATVVWWISKDELEEFSWQFGELNHHRFAIAVTYGRGTPVHGIFLAHMSMDELGKVLHDMDPDIIKRIHKKYLASYLGITMQKLMTFEMFKKKKKTGAVEKPAPEPPAVHENGTEPGQ